MRRAIGDLEQFADKRLFEELSEGMPLIVDNAARLDDTAHRLHRDGEFRASEIMRGFAEEEAAKFLILIDYVRCPRNSEHRTQVLKRFYGHVAKRIHAMACSYPRIASFGELSELVESECRPWYLDGPNGVDWISPNSIAAEREQGLYVDYVPDITDTAGAYRWTTPDAPSPGLSQYATPDSVTLAQALSLAGRNRPYLATIRARAGYRSRRTSGLDHPYARPARALRIRRGRADSAVGCFPLAVSALAADREGTAPA